MIKIERTYSNGKPKYIGYKNENGSIHGEYREYYMNGNVMFTGYYKHGLADKLWVQYSQMGQLKQKVYFII